MEQFRALVVEHQRMVYGMALRMLQDTGEAEEVAQDVFLELYDSLGKIEGPDHVRYWLRRVTVHRATDALRRRKGRPELVAEEWQDEVHSLTDPERSNGATVRLERMVISLPEPYKTPMILRYGEDASPDEIAEILSQPVATVKSHLQRGLAMLREKAQVELKEWVR